MKTCTFRSIFVHLFFQSDFIRHCVERRTLAEYLHTEKDNSYLENYLVPSKNAERYLEAVDIVDTRSVKTMCFTKAYTRFMKGTGSLVNMITPLPEQTDEQERNPERLPRKSENYMLRFFTPEEILSLHGFIPGFEFHPETTKKQKYQMLGNSLSSDLIEYLLTFLFSSC